MNSASYGSAANTACSRLWSSSRVPSSLCSGRITETDRRGPRLLDWATGSTAGTVPADGVLTSAAAILFHPLEEPRGAPSPHLELSDRPRHDRVGADNGAASDMHARKNNRPRADP